MKGIQKNNCISESIYYTHLWVTSLRRETIKVFSEYITFSINFNVGSLGGTTNIKMILYLIPRCLKHAWCYHSHRVPYAGFQVLNVVDLNLADNVLHITKSSGVKSGNLGGQAIGPPLSIHLPGISLSR
jgi:hypothetical protein